MLPHHTSTWKMCLGLLGKEVGVFLLLPPLSLGVISPQLPVDPLRTQPPLCWREGPGLLAGGTCRRDTATPGLSKDNLPRNQEVTGAMLASSF